MTRSLTKNVGLASLALLLAACSAKPDSPTENSATTKTSIVTIGSELVDCMGVAPMKCLVVDGSLFYSQIEGFEFESGYHYELEIEREQRFNKENAPADASLYHYRLVKILSKTQS